MTIIITSAQREILVDCVRAALVGWLVTDPVVGQQARRIEARSTSILGFSFSRFASAAMAEISPVYLPRCPGSAAVFPLTIAEACALANDVELEMATDDQILAAGILAAHSPIGQPEVGTRDWRTYISMLTRLGLSLDDHVPDWRADVHRLLAGFRRAVAEDHLAAAE